MRIGKFPTLGRAHEWAIKTVLAHGVERMTENGEQTIECEPLAVEVSHPLSLPRVASMCPYGDRFLEEYSRDIFLGSGASGTGSEFAYTYHNRLFKWESPCDPSPADQINSIIERIKKSSATRRAIACTWIPQIDGTADNPPCLISFQVMVRDGYLNAVVTMRSNDTLMAMGPNMIGFVSLQQYIALKTGYNTGTYTHIATIPHIYHVRDQYHLSNFCAAMGIHPQHARKP